MVTTVPHPPTEHKPCLTSHDNVSQDTLMPECHHQLMQARALQNPKLDSGRYVVLLLLPLASLHRISAGPNCVTQRSQCPISGGQNVKLKTPRVTHTNTHAVTSTRGYVLEFSNKTPEHRVLEVF